MHTVSDFTNRDNMFDLSNYIKINSNLHSEISKLDESINKLEDDQKNVIDYIKKNLDKQKLIFISGEGGSGKSFLLNILQNFFLLNFMNVTNLATTAAAAKLINGCTIHSSFHIVNLKSNIQYQSSKWHILDSTDIFLIDEISMLSGEILNLINEVLNVIFSHKTKSMENILFGGKSIILIGDLLQLPAVCTKLCPITQLYKSKLFTDYFHPIFIKTNKRANNDPTFSSLLSRCRKGVMNHFDVELLKSRICGTGHIETEECKNLSTSITICAKHTQRKETISEIFRIYYPQSEQFIIKSYDIYENGTKTSNKISKLISDSSGSLEEELILVKNCRIILIKNSDQDSGIVNGLIGEYVNHSDIILQMKLDDNKVIPIPKIKQRINSLESNGTFVYRIQFPILVAYAATVHRVQGATLEKSHLYLDETMFSEGQAYVALSRTKKLDNIHILNFSTNAFKTNLEVVALLEYAEKFGSMKNFWKDFEFDLKNNLNNLKCDEEIIFNEFENEFKEVIETYQINNYVVKNVNSNTNSIEENSFEKRITSIKSEVSYFY